MHWPQSRDHGVCGHCSTSGIDDTHQPAKVGVARDSYIKPGIGGLLDNDYLQRWKLAALSTARFVFESANAGLYPSEKPGGCPRVRDHGRRTAVHLRQLLWTWIDHRSHATNDCP
jgi:hypothetical protein